ncbi:hypothetical protein M427DRAFT_51858 [Gonapodya prolifera JEL478]|uniref:Phospholipase A2 n=1 Tax=Gonapodya prolifera (strain JEL478) TaxID=1344416 RepID=A0A139AVZ1_GONPJ|nr:hypothetical protein M427DRAFT_51858 [Gonapodya prolifera JEL478]|eukprot:KXS20902.1 hypothetical protein M427DRAFT_51858 [Gonapodya prolifera JEL478]
MRFLLAFVIALSYCSAVLGCTVKPLCSGNYLHAVTKPNAPPQTTNGCGASGKFGGLVPEYKFRSCCNAHDLCYGSCGSQKSTCDSNFYNCNKSKCSWWDVSCKGLAATYYEAVKNFGCGPFENAQKGRCTCQYN